MTAVWDWLAEHMTPVHWTLLIIAVLVYGLLLIDKGGDLRDRWRDRRRVQLGDDLPDGIGGTVSDGQITRLIESAPVDAATRAELMHEWQRRKRLAGEQTAAEAEDCDCRGCPRPGTGGSDG